MTPNENPNSEIREPRQTRNAPLPTANRQPPTANFPLVSVIIDNYNYADFLAEAVDSALAQTYPYVEAIVVDDGSTDHSRDIIARYAGRVVPILKPNGGQASAFNAGFRASRGRIVLFLDADDTLCPEALARIVPHFQASPIVKVHWPLHVVDQQGRRTGQRMPAAPLPEGDLRDRVLQGGPTSSLSPPTSGNAWARHFLEQVLPVPESVPYYKSCSDEYLYTLAPVFGHVKALPHPLGTYRVHGKNIYAARPFAEKLQLELSGHAQQCAALSQALAAHGIHVDLAQWQRHSWFHRLQLALQELQAIVPTSETILLIDDGTWHAPESLPQYRVLPFLERDGLYWGPPPDDQTALAELEHLRHRGIRFLALAWPCFWWLEYYPKFAAHLRNHFPAPIQNERLVLFHLTPGSHPEKSEIRNQKSEIGDQRSAIRDQESEITHRARGSACSPVETPTSTFNTPSSPLVSIVINNFNYARFLPDAIESALAQTYPHTEVVVVDDGSTDDSRQVVARYGQRISTAFQPNGGQGATYNQGFRLSRGQIICYLDADDTLDPQAVERIVPLLQDPAVVKAQWHLRLTREDGTPTGQIIPTHPPPEGDLRDQIIRDGPLYDWHLTPPGSGNAYARSFLERVFPMPEPPYRNGADVYLVTLAPAYGCIRTAPSPLGNYRAHGQNNYLGRPLDDDRLRNYLSRFEANSRALQQHLQRQGITCDPNLWQKTNFNHLWPARLLRAKSDIRSRIPSGAKYLLVNNDEWGPGQPVPGRQAVPFLEREGEYDGPPANDVTAVAELERMRAQGAAYILFWWTAFWWLDQYPDFHRHLQANFPCLLNDEHLLLFDLQPGLAEEKQPRQDRHGRSTMKPS